MAEKSKAGSKSNKTDEIIIKKYANRRLYNTASSSYVTLDDLSLMVKAGEDFVVRDAKTDEDLTRSVLTQIIFEEEAKGQNLLPISFLRQLIGFYGDSMQGVIPSYLEHSMGAFTQGQEELQQQVANTFGGMDMFKAGEEMAKQNMAMFQQTMSMFGAGNQTGAPEKATNSGVQEPAKTASEQAAPEQAASADNEGFDALKDQLVAMQRQLDALAKKGS